MWPSPDFDGQLSENVSSSLRTTSSVYFLRTQFQAFCRNVDSFHHINTEMGALIDKQNINRLVELINQTIQTFGNVHLFPDIPFEIVPKLSKGN